MSFLAKCFALASFSTLRMANDIYMHILTYIYEYIFVGYNGSLGLVLVESDYMSLDIASFWFRVPWFTLGWFLSRG